MGNIFSRHIYRLTNCTFFVVGPLTGRFGEDLSVEDIMRSYGVDPDMFTSYGFSPSTKQNILYVVTSGIFVIMYLKYIKS